MIEKFNPEITEEIFKFASSLLEDEDLLLHNIDEACEYLDITKKVLNKLCKNEEITYIKGSKKLILFRKKDLDEYLVHAYYERNDLNYDDIEKTN